MTWTLNKKIAALFVLLGACFALGGYAALKGTVLPAFLEFEEVAARQTQERIESLLEQAIEDVRITNLEYSAWDQTYDYVNGNRPEFVEENMDPDYWTAADIHLMAVFDVGGQRLSAIFGHPDDASAVDIDWAFDQPLSGDHPLLQIRSVDDSLMGIVSTRLGPMLVTSFPIVTSDGAGPIAGTFITGQVLTAEAIDDIARRVSAAVRFYPTDMATAPPRISTAVSQLMQSGSQATLSVREEAIYGYELLLDIAGEPVGILEIVSPREISQIGAATVRAAGWALAGASIVFLLSALLFMNGFIVGPIRRLTDAILSMQETGDLSAGLTHKSSDEVGVLASEFNVLTERLGTTQQQLEEARDDALESVRAKSEFLARMSHEIRTPMNGVLGMTELLRETPLNPKQQRFTGTIHDSAESLLNIINDILDFSKMEADKVRLEAIDVDLQNLLEETLDGIATTAASKGVELINLARLGLDCSVKTDPVRLRQVLLNLLGNAVKFTDEGEIALVATATDSDDGGVTVTFEVRDTGIGIQPDKQEEIFSSFTQEDGSTTRLYGGTGLGLAISRQLVELMGGELTVESTPGHGSTFSFSLAMARGPELAADDEVAKQPIAGSRALIVDDNATNREILEHQLGGWHAITGCAASADEAIEKLEAAVAADEPYDFAILDVHMPEKDGIELAETIRENPDLHMLRLIVLSSVAESVSEERISSLCISAQLTKPVRQSHLRQALNSMLGESNSSASKSDTAKTRKPTFTGTVLLAEDNGVNRLVAVSMLESLGIKVVVAEDGEEAVAKAEDSAIDLVLMDCQMPRMDGFDATRTIRQQEADETRSRIPIVALTANALEGDRERCLDAGMDEYLSKPFTAEQLQSVLAEFLDKQRQAVAPASKTEAPASQTPPIDRQVLDTLAGMQPPGDEDFVASVIRTYLDTASESRQHLLEAIAAGDAARIASVAHSLKSSSGNLGAIPLADLCLKLEQMGRSKNLDEVSGTHEQFEHEVERVFAELRREIDAEVQSETA